jgi:hypothetical protein
LYRLFSVIWQGNGKDIRKAGGNKSGNKRDAQREPKSQERNKTINGRLHRRSLFLNQLLLQF